MENKKKGFKVGDKCPNCPNGLVIIRNTFDINNKPLSEYACCSRCSWNTLR